MFGQSKNFHRLAIAGFVFAAFSGAALAADERLVILATAKNPEFVVALGDLPENQNTGEIHHGGIYRTTLQVREVLRGELAEKTLTVNLPASHGEMLTMNKEIVVYLTRASDGELTGTWWDDLRRTYSPIEVGAAGSDLDGMVIRVRGYLVFNPQGHVLYESRDVYEALKSGDTTAIIRKPHACLTIANPDRLLERGVRYGRRTVTLRGAFLSNYPPEGAIDLGGCQNGTGLEVL